MNERWGDSQRDREELDAWITREPEGQDEEVLFPEKGGRTNEGVNQWPRRGRPTAWTHTLRGEPYPDGQLFGLNVNGEGETVGNFGFDLRPSWGCGRVRTMSR